MFGVLACCVESSRLRSQSDSLWVVLCSALCEHEYSIAVAVQHCTGTTLRAIVARQMEAVMGMKGARGSISAVRM